MENRASIKVTGIVQGVYFRYRTKEKADELGLFGVVRNLSDGSVHIICEGNDTKIASFIEWCRHGPRGARVDSVIVEWEGYQGNYSTFSINYF